MTDDGGSDETHSGLTIRPATDADVEPVVRVWESARWDARQPHMRARLRYDHEANLEHVRGVVMVEHEVWIACLGDRVVGVLSMVGDRVHQLHVDADRQRRGIGSALLTHAKERSPSGVTLSTFQGNTDARAFYERSGFTAVAFGMSPPPEDEPDVTYRWAP